LRDAEAGYETDFGVDGTATFRMKRGKLSTELTAFVPPDETAGFYLLTIRNDGDAPKKSGSRRISASRWPTSRKTPGR
jgi:cyclic beta-1,2-glucan synthetase